LNIKYSKQKQEMRDDPVLDLVFKAKAFIVKNLNSMIGVVLVAVFALGFLAIYSQIRKSSLGKAEEAFGNAMIEYNNRNIEKAIEGFRMIADNHRSLPQGAESAYMLGSISLTLGRYDEAIQWFNAVSPTDKKIGFISGEALEGLASSYESKGDIPKALEYLDKAMKNDQITYRHNAIRWKMALLYQKTNKSALSETLCKEMLSDTTIGDLRQSVENLLATLTATKG
jgi:tetratricopeptide (TPR) repeat protein